MKVLMLPDPNTFTDIGVSGIHSVIRAWHKHAPDHDIRFVKADSSDYDVFAVHAGVSNRLSPSKPFCSHLHGLYWSGDFGGSKWEWDINSRIIKGLRSADAITVPSNWVAENIQRSMRVDPYVVPHGIDWQDWQHKEKNEGYVLAYCKNRVGDVCDPSFLPTLGAAFPDITFLNTYAPPNCPPNVKHFGLAQHDQMRTIVQRAKVVMSPIKETFGVLTLEAMAAGKPILGFANGGNLDLVKHGVNGYLAEPDNWDDLADGLDYCLKHADTLGANGQEMAKNWTWDNAMIKLLQVYKDALRIGTQPPSVSIVIPSYNYSAVVGRAIESVENQTYEKYIDSIYVVDDGSPDDGATDAVVRGYTERDARVHYTRIPNSGVAVARNVGLSHSRSKYCICLDADDQLDPLYLQACIPALENDPALGIAYTALKWIKPDGSTGISEWPGQYDFAQQLEGKNQVPTACLFRRKMWERLGGYRSRYCPNGAGSEDAELWLRAGAYGFAARRVTDAALFIYSMGSGNVSGDRNYHEVNWRELHPWTHDKKPPFIAVSEPSNGRSHPVYQYDEPEISVIIPVGPGHKAQVYNALDSLESQTYHKWEVIIVDDTGDEKEDWEFDGYPQGLRAYPYVRLIHTPGRMGAGYARNRGAEIARAPMLLFIDADDNLLVEYALDTMMYAWNANAAIAHSDYVGKAYIGPQEAGKLKIANRLLNYDEKSQMAMIHHIANDFDCERAIRQPASPEYIWCLITALLPKAWHNEISGFDEKMDSWEDWDYWIRMARAGKCFIRISEPLVAYRFYTGNRRELGSKNFERLIKYLLSKYDKLGEPMGCKCRGQKAVPPPMRAAQYMGSGANQQQESIMDEEAVMIFYNHPNRGEHRVVGAATGRDYGRHSGGDRFYVLHRDQEVNPDIFDARVVEVIEVPAAPAPPPPPPQSIVTESPSILSQPQRRKRVSKPRPVAVEEGDTPPPALIGMYQGTEAKPFDVNAVPGITPEIAAHLFNMNIDSLEKLRGLGTKGLEELGAAPTRAAATIKRVEKMIAEQQVEQESKPDA